jgi:hypothetical protein
MKEKLIKTILPPIIGILTVLVLLAINNLILYNQNPFSNAADGFFQYFVPFATIIAILIQFFLTLPFWEKFKSQNKVWGLTLFQFTGLIIILSGLAFGLVFSDSIFIINDLIIQSITGILAFAVYWTINLLTLKQLDKILL